MNTKNDLGLHLTGVNTEYQKTLYQAPVLRVYGAVSQLTAGNNGTTADVNNMSMK